MAFNSRNLFFIACLVLFNLIGGSAVRRVARQVQICLDDTTCAFCPAGKILCSGQCLPGPSYRTTAFATTGQERMPRRADIMSRPWAKLRRLGLHRHTKRSRKLRWMHVFRELRNRRTGLHRPAWCRRRFLHQGSGCGPEMHARIQALRGS
ncbi:hypothetical protein B0H14DRAFT_1228179 [Mycena olivaceomarginata]|nr:hypothetical protein B0H14DRAFT_1228179 [Mycena olivaceomarginata]